MSGYSRRHVFAAACLGMLVFGIVMTVLGTILPSLIERFGVDTAVAGSSISLLTMGILIGSLVFGPIADRYGSKALLTSCSALVLIGLEALAFAPNFDLLRAAVFIVGFGGGVINGGTNALVSDISEGKRGAGLSLLGVFFGIGAAGVPFLLGLLSDVLSYAVLTALIGLPVAGALVYFGLVTFPWAKQPHGLPVSLGKELTRDPALLLLGSMLFLQSGVEITAGGWTSSYLQEAMDVSTGSAAFGLSLFWSGVALARLFLGAALQRWSSEGVLRGFILLAIVGSTVMVSATTPWLAFTGIFVMGVGLSACFPIVLAYAGDLYPDISGTVFSVLFAIAMTGGSLAPLLTGWLGAASSLRTSFMLVPVALAVMLVLHYLATARIRVRTMPETPSTDG